jgi:hypothetical protein
MGMGTRDREGKLGFRIFEMTNFTCPKASTWVDNPEAKVLLFILKMRR